MTAAGAAGITGMAIGGGGPSGWRSGMTCVGFVSGCWSMCACGGGMFGLLGTAGRGEMFGCEPIP